MNEDLQVKYGIYSKQRSKIIKQFGSNEKKNIFFWL